MIRACALVCLVLAVVGCGGSDEKPTEVVLVTHDSFAISEGVKQAFEDDSGLALRILKAGDAGEIVTRALLTAGNPEGDVLFGVDNNLLARALAGDVFEPYESPALGEVHQELILDPEHRATPIDRGDVCLNYDNGVVRRPRPDTTAESRRPDPAALPRPPRRREPRDVDPRTRLHARHDRAVRRSVAGLLAQAARERRPRRRRLGGRVLRPLLGRGREQGESTDRRLVRIEPPGRGDLPRPEARRGADAGSSRGRASGRSSSPASCAAQRTTRGRER